MTKRVLLTGASAGIGWDTAILLAKEHYELVLVARREDRLRELAQSCRAEGATRVDIIAADLGHKGIAEEIVEKARGIPPLVLVNNAGIAEFGPFAEMPLDRIEATFELNLLAPMRLCHAIIPVMLEKGGGQIVNVLSMAATHVLPGSAAYATSKAALHMLGKTLSADYRKQGIRISSIIPGATDTELWDRQSFQPDRADMVPAKAVAEVIRDVVISPPDRNFDEITVMPPKGIL